MKLESAHLAKQEDIVTQELASPEVFSETPMVEVVAEEIQGRDAVTQEPTPPEVILEVQNVQIGTSGDKVGTQHPQNFVSLDFDDEEHDGDEEILKVTKELSILRI